MIKDLTNDIVDGALNEADNKEVLLQMEDIIQTVEFVSKVEKKRKEMNDCLDKLDAIKRIVKEPDLSKEFVNDVYEHFKFAEIDAVLNNPDLNNEQKDDFIIELCREIDAKTILILQNDVDDMIQEKNIRDSLVVPSTTKKKSGKVIVDPRDPTAKDEERMALGLESKLSPEYFGPEIMKLDYTIWDKYPSVACYFGIFKSNGTILEIQNGPTDINDVAQIKKDFRQIKGKEFKELAVSAGEPNITITKFSKFVDYQLKLAKYQANMAPKQDEKVPYVIKVQPNGYDEKAPVHIKVEPNKSVEKKQQGQKQIYHLTKREKEIADSGIIHEHYGGMTAEDRGRLSTLNADDAFKHLVGHGFKKTRKQNKSDVINNILNQLKKK